MLGRKISFLFTLFILPFFIVSPTFAHVIITPGTVGIAKTQDFIVSVPNEKNNPVVEVKLLIPQGVTSVIPYVLNGWTITTATDSNNNVTQIDWTDGSIPVGQAQELTFSAQAPARVTTLAWKAYETYSDGTVVNWDVDPKALTKLSDAQQDALADKENKGGYSTTHVVNDLAVTPNATVSQFEQSDQKATTALIFSIIAIGIACVALSIAKRKETPPFTPRKSKPTSRSSSKRSR